MKRNILYISLAMMLAGSYAVSQTNFPRRPSPWDRIQFGEDENDEECLCNSFCIEGAKAILVNLDDHCELEKWEEFGIYIQSGDIIFITGRERSSAGQDWAMVGTYDTNVIDVSSNTSVNVPNQTGYTQ
jgi:hypothetical protein